VLTITSGALFMPTLGLIRFAKDFELVKAKREKWWYSFILCNLEKYYLL